MGDGRVKEDIIIKFSTEFSEGALGVDVKWQFVLGHRLDNLHRCLDEYLFYFNTRRGNERERGG